MDCDTVRLEADAEALAQRLFRADYGGDSPHLQTLLWHRGVAGRGDVKPHYRKLALQRLRRG